MTPRKTLLLLAALTVVLWLLTGCAGVEDSNGGQHQEADGSDGSNQQQAVGQEANFCSAMPAERTEDSKRGKDSNKNKLVFITGSDVTYNDVEVTANNPASTDLTMYVMNADGTGLTRLTKTTAPEYGLANRLSQGREATINWTGDGTRIESISYEPGCSPDGTKIAYADAPQSSSQSSSASAYPSADIYVKTANGNDPSRLTNTPGVDEVRPVWSPDGKRILYSSSSKPTDVYVMNADGSNQTDLTMTDLVYDLAPVWSPNGKQIAFSVVDYSTSPTEAGIYLINADGTGLTRLTPTPEGLVVPMYSPDGKKIAFVVGYGKPGHTAKYDIYVINVDGTGRTRLTNNAAWEGIITWVLPNSGSARDP